MEALEKNVEITPTEPSKPSKPSTPSNPEETTKPEVKPSTKPETGDTTTMVGLFAFFSMISLLGYVLLKKKEA